MTAQLSASFFLDRGLGSVLVPEGLRAHGWRVTTMDERYGVAASQDIADVDWIRDATEVGDCLLTKDSAMARNPTEAQTIYACDARVFTITNARITGPDLLARLLLHQAAVFRWAHRARPPFVLGLGPTSVARIRLNLPW